MDSVAKLDYISKLQEQLKSFTPLVRDLIKLDAFHRRAKMFIRSVFGDDSQYIWELDTIYSAVINAIGSPDEMYGEQLARLRNLLGTLEEDVRFQSISLENSEQLSYALKPNSNKVFIVHGHDDAMKQAVARTLEKLGLEAIILHERPNQGKTIIEKFSDYADVSFAVILLSPDDLAYPKDSTRKKPMSRARQNVILELGYFLGKLGRARVTALHTPENNFEIPSDYSGVLFIPYDGLGQWRFDLVKELQAGGFEIDANKLTR